QIFDTIASMGHEQVTLCHDPAAGYRGIIAIHSTVLGPALGGTRFWSYATDEEAIVDALRLARGMTYKNAVAGLNLGGGKSVIIGDNKTTSRELLFRAHGRFVETLGGRYITAKDFGATPVAPEEIYGVKADIFAPCALGAIINDNTIPQLQVEIVAGAANNQLLEERHGDMLEEMGILYTPDYVANAGGVINVYSELAGWTSARAFSKADEIYDTVLKVFATAKEVRMPTYQAAER